MLCIILYYIIQIKDVPNLLKAVEIDILFHDVKDFVDMNCESRDYLGLEDIIKIYLYFTGDINVNSPHKEIHKTKNNDIKFEGGVGTLRTGRFNSINKKVESTNKPQKKVFTKNKSKVTFVGGVGKSGYKYK